MSSLGWRVGGREPSGWICEGRLRTLLPPARLMSSVKDNVGRGLNIALVNGESLRCGVRVQATGAEPCRDLPPSFPTRGRLGVRLGPLLRPPPLLGIPRGAWERVCAGRSFPQQK